MKPVLFASLRPLDRAENIKAVYDAYGGEKEFVQVGIGGKIPGLHSGKYDLMVADELPGETPGKCIFIGHAMGAGKTYGLDQPWPYFHDPGLLTYAITSSREMVPLIAKQLGLPEEKVLPVGLPRTDAYFGADKEESPYKEHLYVPTFRRGYNTWLPEMCRIQHNIPEGNRLTVKLHPITGDIFKSVWPDIRMAPSMEPSTSYLVNTDTVITDYSSIMFDAMVLRKPVILFAKDRERYLKDRGMYYDYPSCYCGRYCETEEDLAEHMKTAVWSKDDEDVREFFSDACDGHSTKRVIDLIRSLL